MLKTILIAFSVISSLSLSSSIDDYFPSNPFPSSSNLGETGLINMPSARHMEGGVLKLGISASYPNEYTTMVAAPFDWLEAAYRYTEIKTVKYGQSWFSGNQTDKDKAFDFKIRLIKESTYLPNVSFGIRDLGGTGRFSSEYLVASKRFGRLDASLGVGWGVLGADANIRNPLISIHDSFKDRSFHNDAGDLGGQFSYNTWFSGQRAAIFGGIEYLLPKYGLSLKLEYDTSNPDIASAGLPVKVDSRINAGIFYSLGQWIDLGLSYERGSQFTFSFYLKGNYGKKDLIPKLDKPKNVIPLNMEQKKRVLENPEIFYRSLNLSLRDENLFIQGSTMHSDAIDVAISQTRFRSNVRTVGRTARIVSALSPDSIETLKISVMNGDTEVMDVSLNRKELNKLNQGSISVNEMLTYTDVSSNSSDPVYKRSEFQPKVNFPEVFWKMTPALRHQIGGPEAFYLGQLWWKVNTTIKFRRNLSVYSTLGFDIYNNFNELNNPSYSSIAHVRSDIQSYLKEGKNNLARLKLEYLWSPYKDVFARFDFGLLEEMFGGYGGELLYRPFGSDFMVSVMLHKVKQRGYKQRFSFRDYETTTGFLQFYKDFNRYKITSQVLIGKYLAGDKGITLDLSREFNTGFRLGIFATKTDLSAEEFGEGSFDKGFYFSIPTKLFFTDYTTGHIGFGISPLTKDGGARLWQSTNLYGVFGDSHASSIIRDWDALLD